MAFATALAFLSLFSGSALALMLSDNQFAKDFHWAVPWLWALAAISAAICLASAKWFRSLFISESQEAISQEIIKQKIIGSGNRQAGGHYYETHNTTINTSTNGRSLEPWQKVSIMGHLKQECFAGTSITVLAHSEKESMNYAAQMVRLLIDCGWSATGPHRIPLTVSLWDIQISADNRLGEHATAAALYDALANARIRCKPGHTLDGNVTPNQIVLWVGVEGPSDSQPGTNNPPLHFDPSWTRPRQSKNRPVRFVLGGFDR